LNPVFEKLIIQCNQQIKSSKSLVVLSPAFSPFVRVAAGHTPKGLIAVDIGEISSLFNTIDKNSDLIPDLYFSLFASSLDSAMMHRALDGYLRFLDNAKAGTLSHRCAGARIATSFRIDGNSDVSRIPRDFLDTVCQWSVELIPKTALLDDPDLLAVRYCQTGEQSADTEQFSVMEQLLDFLFSIEDFADCENFPEVGRRIEGIVTRLNCMMPFSKQSNPVTNYSSLIRVQANGIRKLNDATLSIPAMTHLCRCSLIAQKVDDAIASYLFSQVLCGLRLILRHNYLTRTRPLGSIGKVAIPVCPKYIIYFAADDLLRISDFENCELLSEMTRKFTTSEFFKIRRNAIASFSALSTFRHIFSLEQPSVDSLWLAPHSGEFLTSVADFQFPKSFRPTATTLTPVLQKFFGKTLRGEMTLVLSAISQSFAANLEKFRSLCEVVIGEGKVKSESFFELRDAVEENMMLFAPPNSPTATVDDSLEWIGAVDAFIDRSMGRFQIGLEDTPVPAPRQAEQEKETEGENEAFYENPPQFESFDDPWALGFL
jgi:hypothetical protein